jgi:hypothetical protein
MQRKILGESLFICSRILQSLPPFKTTNFMKCVRELWITLYLCPWFYKYL